MLWDIIRDFFVIHIFGGYSADGNSYGGFWGGYDSNFVIDLEFQLFGQTITLGDYLSNIATIISLVIILLLCCLLIKKIYNMCAHIIG